MIRDLTKLARGWLIAILDRCDLAEKMRQNTLDGQDIRAVRSAVLRELDRRDREEQNGVTDEC